MMSDGTVIRQAAYHMNMRLRDSWLCPDVQYDIPVTFIMRGMDTVPLSVAISTFCARGSSGSLLRQRTIERNARHGACSCSRRYHWRYNTTGVEVTELSVVHYRRFATTIFYAEDTFSSPTRRRRQRQEYRHQMPGTTTIPSRRGEYEGLRGERLSRHT